MTIAAVKTHRLSAPLHTPFVTALRRTTTVESLIVEVVDSDDHSGLGEAPQVWTVTGASIAGAEACVQEMLAPVLIGRDPADLNTMCRGIARAVVGNETAKAAVEVALHDLAARRLGISLVCLLGGTSLSVPTDVTISAGDAHTMARTAKERQSEGFTILKVKVGADPDGDLARIRAICATAGPGVLVRLDANQGWTPREAVQIIGRISAEGLAVELVEQPVHRSDLDGLAWVTQRSDIPIMADETVFGVRDLTEVIRRRAADLVNVKLAKCGGLTTARTLLELATAHGIGTCIGSMMEGPIGIGAAAALASAHPTTVTSDLDAAWWLQSSPVNGGPHYSGASLHRPMNNSAGRRVAVKTANTIPIANHLRFRANRYAHEPSAIKMASL